MGASRNVTFSLTEQFCCVQYQHAVPLEEGPFGATACLFRKRGSFLQELASKAASLLSEREREGKEGTQ